jgi:hypothetical protein
MAEGFFFSWFPWSYVSSVTSGISEVIPSDSWFVNSIWFLLSMEQVAIGTCGSLLPVYAKWLDLFVVFTRWQLCCLTLQLYLVSSSLSRMGKFSFEYPLSPTKLAPWSTTSHFGSLACHPTPTLSTCSSPHLCSLKVQLLVPPLILGGWFSVPPHPRCQW